MTRRTPEQYNWDTVTFDETILGKHITSPRRERIQFVVIHHMAMVGTGNGAANDACYRTWQTREASAHYGVDGKYVRQFVWDSDAAWATANTHGNHAGISIEHANSTASPSWKVSDQTVATGAKLVAYLHKAYALGRPVLGKTLFQHRDFYSTTCAGPYLGGSHLDEYVAEAQHVYDSITGTTPAPAPAPTPTPATYTVRSGDTLSAIASRFGVTVAQLTEWNRIADPNKIEVGQVLRLTAPSTTPTPVRYPADLFGKGWKYTSPFDGPDSGSYADEIKQPKLATYTSSALAVESSGAVVFTVHHGGKTTSGSKNPRSELREMTADGLNEREWDGRRGRHRMKNLTLSIDHLTVVKPHVVVAQIHGADDDLTVLRGEGVKGTNRIKMWLTKGDTTHGFSLGEVRLGDRFTFGFDVESGKVHFDWNGTRQLFTVAATDDCYFKTGCYLQSNPETAPGESTSAYAQVRLYTKPEVSHA